MCPAPALGRPMGPALSGRVAASDEQIREPEQQRDALRVLRQSPVAHLTVKSRVVCKSERKLLDASVRLPWRPPSVREA